MCVSAFLVGFIIFLEQRTNNKVQFLKWFYYYYCGVALRRALFLVVFFFCVSTWETCAPHANAYTQLMLACVCVCISERKAHHHNIKICTQTQHTDTVEWTIWSLFRVRAERKRDRAMCFDDDVDDDDMAIRRISRMGAGRTINHRFVDWHGVRISVCSLVVPALLL